MNFKADQLPSSPKKKSSSAGKPKAFALAVEAKQPTSHPSSTTGTKTPRGRPKRKALVAMYQSQLSENTMGIKIRLKKSLEAPIAVALSGRSNSTSTSKRKSTMPMSSTVTSKQAKKRQRKSKQKDTSDSDDSEYEKRRKNNNTTIEKHRNRKQTTTTASDYTEPEEQSNWGDALPEHILLKIFEDAVNQYGCLPTVVNVGRVCSLWRRVSLSPQLWHTLDLSTWTKDRSEINLKRIIAKHLRWCKDVNLGTLHLFSSSSFVLLFVVISSFSEKK